MLILSLVLGAYSIVGTRNANDAFQQSKESNDALVDSNRALVDLLNRRSATIDGLNEQSSQDNCVASISAKFFGHIAEGLSADPGTPEYKAAREALKTDAPRLAAIDEICYPDGPPDFGSPGTTKPNR